ncbi:ATP-binding protein, Mrp/Nbp35 family [Listeria cornellensis FSL F6-0969]|uniref:ATP-binding protein, Mrp/Nbp35 family n=1 Tax=Listeria cornellensis FSL F6-0969 TaxID=1265820 RepID=W7BDM1_9LIST|nr:ATP-binding protein, Mrp/Nbp35 family [Listeria cornellensis FSL F6-0969]
MLNEQQITKLLQRVLDPLLEFTLQETDGILEVNVIKNSVALHIALADPELHTEEFTTNITELLGEFGCKDIHFELAYLPVSKIEQLLAAKKKYTVS